MKFLKHYKSMLSASAMAASILLSSSQAQASLIYGLDAKNETSVGAGDATFNEYTGFGVDITSPTTLANWLTATALPVPATSLTPTFNTAAATTTIVANPTGLYAITMTFKVDLTGSHNVTFDKFGIGFQRGGTTVGNIVGSALYSTDGVNFSAATVGENDLVNTGPADNLTLKTPDGFGGTIGVNQVYVVGGLSAAGALNSGSFYVRLTVGAPTSAQATLTLLNDRYDLSTSGMMNATANTTDLGADDGYDLVWYGSATPVPEPSTMALGLVGGLALLVGIRRRA